MAKDFKINLEVAHINGNKYIKLDDLVLSFADMLAEGYNIMGINDLIKSLRALNEKKKREEKMRVIFLDLDGVLNSVALAIYKNRLRLSGIEYDSTNEDLDAIACSNLQYVLEECLDVKIVISSTWRKYHTIEELKKIFDQIGIASDRIIGVTPESDSGYRGHEIDSYLKSNPEIDRFVIIDDDDDMEPHMNRLVNTDGRNGFTFTDAEKVVEMLGEQNEKEDESKENKDKYYL